MHAYMGGGGGGGGSPVLDEILSIAACPCVTTIPSLYLAHEADTRLSALLRQHER